MSSSASLASWDLLDEKEELDLHKHRLLNVEEKPFKRITKRLVTVSTRATNIKPSPPSTATAASDAISNGTAGDQPSSAPDADETQSSQRTRQELELLKEDLALDFAAFESSIVRLQFLLDANARERERYQADQERILAESAAVREQNAELREQLEVARGTLAQRKKFDELAERITSNKALKPRTEQRAALLKLEEECAELERESETYKVTWRERREQFARIMEEGMNLRRLIRDEKEEVDRREGMNEDADNQEGGEDSDASASVGVDTPHGDAAGMMKDAGTPRAVASVGGRTPARDGSQPPAGTLGDAQRLLDPDMLRPVPEGVADAGSRSGSREHSRESMSQRSADDDDHNGDHDDDHTDNADDDDDDDDDDEDDDDEDDGEVKEGDDDDDVDMVDPGKAAGDMPQIAVYAPEGGGDSMEVDAN